MNDEADFEDTATIIAEFEKVHPGCTVITDHDLDDPLYGGRINVAIADNTGNIIAAYHLKEGCDDEYVFEPDSPWADELDVVRFPLSFPM